MLLVGERRGEAGRGRRERGLREERLVAEAPADLGRFAQRGSPGVVATGAHLGPPLREQHRPTAPWIVELEVERRERIVEQGDGLLPRHRRERMLAGTGGVVGRAGGVPGRRRLEEVVRELGERRIGPVAVEGEERLADRCVERDAVLRGQIVVQRLADQPVREAVAAEQTRHLLDEPGRRRLVELPEQRDALLLHDQAQGLDAELGADDGGRGERARNVSGERIEPPADRVAHALRNPEAPRGALGGLQAHELIREQRIALGDGMQVIDERRRRVSTLRRDQLVQLAPRQAAQDEPLRDLAEVRQRERQLAVAPGRAEAAGADGEDPGPVDPAGEELEEPHGRDIRGLEVVEHDDDRPPRRRGAHERRRRVERREALRLALERHRALHEAGQPLDELGSDMRDIAGRRTPDPRPPRQPAAAAPAPG